MASRKLNPYVHVKKNKKLFLNKWVVECDICSKANRSSYEIVRRHRTHEKALVEGLKHAAKHRTIVLLFRTIKKIYTEKEQRVRKLLEQ